MEVLDGCRVANFIFDLVHCVLGRYVRVERMRYLRICLQENVFASDVSQDSDPKEGLRRVNI